MSQLKNLIQKPLSEMSDEELEAQISALTRSKITQTKTPKNKKIQAVKSNKEKQIENLLSQLDSEQLAQLLGNLKEQA